MLPTTNVPRPGNRFRSARNQSVLSKASDMVSSTFTWSSRNSKNSGAAYHAYKKNDNYGSNSYGSNNSGSSNGGGMIAIDTSYLSSNIPFTDAFPNNSKSAWGKLKKKTNRQFLDKPWLLPTLIGSSFVAAVLIIFFTVFSGSSKHDEIVAPTVPASNTNTFDANSNDYQRQYEGAHRTMRKKHSKTSTSSYKPQTNVPPSNNYYNNNNNNNQRQQEDYSNSNSRFSLEKSVDHVFNLFHNNDANRWNAVTSLSQKYCLQDPYFHLANQDAIDNLKGNIGTLLFDIVKFNPIYTDVTPNDVVISNKGTFIKSNNVGNKYSSKNQNHDTTQCDLVTYLFQLADDLGMLHPTTNNLHNFDIDSDTFWQDTTHQADVNHKTINEDVTTLFEYANNNQFYEISMELPKLVEKHCSHTKVWIQNIGEKQSENFYNSLSRAIFTVNNAETSEISDNIIGFPVIDSNGDLMQLESGVLTFDKNDLNSHKNLHYSRCELLDKIVFHGLTMSMNKHIDFMFDAAKKDDYYGFEVLADLLDTEYCNIINDKLSVHARNNLGLHLWTLVKDIIDGKFHLMSNDINDESNEYIITTDGGIMHSKTATNELKLKKTQIIHCSMIKEIVKRGIKYHSNNMDYYSNINNNNYDKNEYEHRYDDSGLSKEFNSQMTGDSKMHNMNNNKQLIEDASLLIKYLKNGQETEFVKLLDYLLDQYHSEWFNKLTKENDYHTARSIKLMIEQTLHSVILGHVNLSSSYDAQNDLTILRKDVNELEVIHKNDFKTLAKDTLDNLEQLPLLDEIFQQVINNKN